MTVLRVWLTACLLAFAARADEPEAPSMELLLYLSEWAIDPNGRLVDPMDLPEDIDPTVRPTADEPARTTATKPEPSR